MSGRKGIIYFYSYIDVGTNLAKRLTEKSTAIYYKVFNNFAQSSKFVFALKMITFCDAK
jgi:hypothetical protein